MKAIYFKGLTEIRAIAALCVLFHHIELYKYRDKINGLYDGPLHNFISALGKNGVYIFFVLSGFLISYLLLTERQLKGRVHVRKFYLRRILRIWPLYYLIVFLGFVIIPLLANNIEALQHEGAYYSRILMLQESPWLTLLLFLLFLPNVAMAIRPSVVGAAQSWSVGVEEQFYLAWPHLFNLVKKKTFLLASLILIAMLPVFSFLANKISPEIGENFRWVLRIIPIHFMAIGSIAGFLLFYKSPLIKKIFQNPILFIANTVVLFALLFYPFSKMLFAIVCAAQILFIVQENFKFNLRSKKLQWVGKISYGVYMFHPFMMYIGFSLANSVFKIENMIGYNVFIYLSIALLTFLVSTVSYRYFESKFIALKNTKFTVVKSRNKDLPEEE